MDLSRCDVLKIWTGLVSAERMRTQATRCSPRHRRRRQKVRSYSYERVTASCPWRETERCYQNQPVPPHRSKASRANAKSDKGKQVHAIHWERNAIHEASLQQLGRSLADRVAEIGHEPVDLNKSICQETNVWSGLPMFSSHFTSLRLDPSRSP